MVLMADGATQVHKVIGMPIYTVYIEIMLQMLACYYEQIIVVEATFQKIAPEIHENQEGDARWMMIFRSLILFRIIAGRK